MPKEPLRTCRLRLTWPLLVLALVVALMGCRRDRPEDVIRRTLDDAIVALGQKDARLAGAVLAEDYSDEGKRTKKDLVRLAFMGLQRGPVFVKLTSVDTEVSGSSATSRVKALAVQGSASVKSAADLLDTNARTFDLTLTWRRDGDEWLITAMEGLPRVSFE